MRPERCVARASLIAAAAAVGAVGPTALAEPIGADGTMRPLVFRYVAGDLPGGSVLGSGAEGAFDARWTAAPSVLRAAEGYRMWYSGYFSAKEGPGGIGLATSGDGLRWERRNGGQPVLGLGPAGAFDARQVLAPEVHRDGDRYLMWYTGQSDREHASRIVTYQIGLATSLDGLTWTRANGGEPVVSNGPAGSPDEVQAATPSIVRETDGWRMWYAAWSPTHHHTICAARSRDGVEWERENGGEPVSGLSPAMAYGHAVMRIDDGYLMLYMALKATRGLYAAASRNGLHWTMLNDGNPVLGPDGEGFDADIVGHPYPLVEGETLRVWYTGYQRQSGSPSPLRLQIGLAEAPLRG